MEVIDFTDALNIIKIEKQRAGCTESNIGVVIKQCQGMAAVYEIGEVVLYSDLSDGTLTISKPMNKADLRRQKERGSLLTEWKTIIGVPKKNIAKVIGLD